LRASVAQTALLETAIEIVASGSGRPKTHPRFDLITKRIEVTGLCGKHTNATEFCNAPPYKWGWGTLDDLAWMREVRRDGRDNTNMIGLI
jgi:hypothetical protein